MNDSAIILCLIKKNYSDSCESLTNMRFCITQKEGKCSMNKWLIFFNHLHLMSLKTLINIVVIRLNDFDEWEL